MGNINKFRMYGRIDRTTQLLLQKYNLVATGNNVSLKLLVSALANNVNPDDRTLCEDMVRYLDQTDIESDDSLFSDSSKQEIAIGQNEASFICGKYPHSYQSKVLLDQDFTPEMAEDARMAAQRKRRKRFIWLGVIAAVIIGIVIYNLPYFAEQREFNKVKDAYAEGYTYSLDYAIDRYFTKYPDGKHTGEVLMMGARLNLSENHPLEALEYIDRCIKADPSAPLVADCKQLSDSIWDAEVTKYETKAAKAASKEGVDFVMNMLRYMQKYKLHTIKVVAEPVLELKEYSEYPAGLRMFMEMDQDPSSPQLPDDMVTIKDKISIRKAKGWVEYVVKALNHGFNNILTPGFIKFTDEPNADESELCPVVNVKYIITTQESTPGIPDIWVYSETTNFTTVPKNLILGIGMKFDAEFILPETNQTFSISETGDPGSQSIDGDPTSAYSIMCQRCTAEFASTIQEAFGLPESE